MFMENHKKVSINGDSWPANEAEGRVIRCEASGRTIAVIFQQKYAVFSK